MSHDPKHLVQWQNMWHGSCKCTQYKCGHHNHTYLYCQTTLLQVIHHLMWLNLSYVCSLHSILTLISSRVNPLPALSLRLYLTVGHLITGLRGPPTGRGWILTAFSARLLRLLCLRAGWLNHVFTYLCQSLWKWALGIILLRLAGMIALKLDTEIRSFKEFSQNMYAIGW